MDIIFYSVDNNLGKNVRTLRKEKGWTQTDLAKKLDCSQELIGAYERGTRNPPADKIPAIAKVLGISINALYSFKPAAKEKKAKNPRLIKKLQALETLPSKAQKQVTDYINLVLKANGNK